MAKTPLRLAQRGFAWNRRVMTLFWYAFLDAIRGFSAKGGFVRASHVALSMMLAIFPFCILVLSVAGILSRAGLSESGADLGDLLDIVFGSWPEAIAAPIEREVRAVMETSGSSTLTLGALLTILFASNGFDAVRVAVSSAYHHLDDPRPAWKQRLLAIGFAVGGAILVTFAGLFTVVVPIYVHFVADIAPVLHLEALTGDGLRTLVTTGVLLFALVACHKWLSGVRRPLRALWPGIILTIILWAIFASGFEYYIKTFSTYSVTYAGLAGVMSALVFMYLMAAVFVLGAEYNASLGKMARKTATSDSELQ